MQPKVIQAKPYVAQPGGSLTQFKLLLMLGFQPGVLRKHLLVFGFVVDWWHKDYQDALASVRHIVAHLKARDPHGRGLYTGDVHSALNDLVEWGWLKQEKGSGRRASRYVPVWEKSYSVLEIPNTSDIEISVLESPNTGVLETPNATATSVLELPNKDSLTGPGLRTGVRVGENDMFKATPSAHLAVGHEATAAPTASGGFNEFWKSYPRKHGKTKAAAAYAKLSPDAVLHARLMVAVDDWAAHYSKHGTDKKWIPEPANWLANERWDEDLPIIHGDAKGAAITKAKANALPKPANDNAVADGDADDDGEQPKKMVCDVGVFSPFGTFTAMVTDIVTSGEDNEHWKISLELKNREHHFETEHCFSIVHNDKELQTRGRKFVDDIVEACGVRVTENSDLDEITFIEFQATIDDRLSISYRPLPSGETVRLLGPTADASTMQLGR